MPTLKWWLMILACVASFYVGLRTKAYIDKDTCLDKGGRYVQGLCDT